ncbi:hypothetical protein LZ554_003925 [Drepanopeziza brunnea f. sp. 'monogermtubi']|nr:hypothetical protein LZ554_003925 [Drepanopeziza brunnea f. sp. 'monogermtubi']
MPRQKPMVRGERGTGLEWADVPFFRSLPAATAPAPPLRADILLPHMEGRGGAERGATSTSCQKPMVRGERGTGLEWADVPFFRSLPAATAPASPLQADILLPHMESRGGAERGATSTSLVDRADLCSGALWGDPRPRIYVPHGAPEQFEYCWGVARDRPEIRLDVCMLPEKTRLDVCVHATRRLW